MVSVLLHIIEHALSHIVVSFPKLCLWTEESFRGSGRWFIYTALSELRRWLWRTGGTSGVKVLLFKWLYSSAPVPILSR